MAKTKKPKNGREEASLKALTELVHLGMEQDRILQELRDSYGSAIPEISGIKQNIYMGREPELDRLRRLIVEYHRGE